MSIFGPPKAKGATIFPPLLLLCLLYKATASSYLSDETVSKLVLNPSSYKAEMENVEDGGILTYNGRYVMYNVLGNLFELSSKYIPPIQPVGRGAYGIVW